MYNNFTTIRNYFTIYKIVEVVYKHFFGSFNIYYHKDRRIRTGECTSIFGFGSYPPKFSYKIPSKFHQDSLQFSCHVPQNSLHSSPSIIRYQNHLTSIKMSDDSDFGFGSSSPYSDDDEPSTTTTEALIDDGSEGEQQQ